MNWDIEAPNVVTEARFRELVESGYSAEILCQESAHKKGPRYYGVWILRVVSDDGVEKLLVTARTRTTYNDIKIREFKTISGVVSFFIGLGFAHVDLPLEAGTSRWTPILERIVDVRGLFSGDVNIDGHCLFWSYKYTSHALNKRDILE